MARAGPPAATQSASAAATIGANSSCARDCTSAAGATAAPSNCSKAPLTMVPVPLARARVALAGPDRLTKNVLSGPGSGWARTVTVMVWLVWPGWKVTVPDAER